MNSFIRPAVNRKIMRLLFLVSVTCIFLFPLYAASSNADTTWSVSFNLNMTKAVNQHVFSPDSDYVSLNISGIQAVRLVRGPGNIYSATLVNKLDSGVAYFYNFRINESVWENVNRTLIPKTQVLNLSSWWNNDPISITTFIVNMEYAVQEGKFNPLADSVCIIGTLNSQQQSPTMQRMENSLNYSWVDSLLDPGSVQQYKYRINADSAGLELRFNPARIVRIPDTILEVHNDFDNFNPGKLAVTFQCDMGYYVKTHKFDPLNDFLDIAGNFNGNGANDVLFDLDKDTIYAIQIFLDTTWIRQGPLTFKFRINGSWNSAELAGKPSRTYAMHDTIGQDPNSFGCHFNNLDPSIPTPPWVYNVDIQGLLIYKKFLSGMYAYENVNGIPEGTSTYRWLRSNNALGTGATPIDSATRITYVVDTLDIGKWLVFEVTPKAASGDSAVGQPVRIVSSNSISAWDVGVDEFAALITRVYPNPAHDLIAIEARKEIEHVELISFSGQLVLHKDKIGLSSVSLQVGGLPAGIYLLRARTSSGMWGATRVVKY